MAIISVYRVSAAPAPIVTCVGTPESPVALAADATSCALTVDAASGLAGACADGGGGLATCELDGGAVVSLRPGPRAIRVVATSPGGATASCTSYVSVADVTAPVVSVSPSPAVLWPPNRQLVPIDLPARAWDACDGELVPRCAAVSSEPGGALGTISPDVVWTDGALWLRAESTPGGPGRTYAITCDAADAAGNVGYAMGAVSVPHDVAR